MSPSDLEVSALRALINLASVSPAEAAAALDVSKCRAEDFGGRFLGPVAALVETFAREGRVPDAVVFVEKLRPSIPGAARVVTDLFLAGDSHLHPTERLKAVREAGRRRRASGALGVVTALLGDPSTATTEAVSALARVLEDLQTDASGGACTLDGDVVPFLDHLDEVDRGNRAPVLETGLEGLDAIVGGLQPRVLTFVGSLPGVGKSALLAALVRNLAGRGLRVGLLSLEDERRWLTARLTAEAANVPIFVLLNRRMGQHQKERVQMALESIFPWLSLVDVDDRPALSVAEVVASARQMVRRGAKALLVDHLGEIRVERTDRHDLDVMECVQQLRALAKTYAIPVVVLCHLKRREGLTPKSDEPRMTDFAFSASIERSARVALALSRPNFGGERDDTLRVHVLKQTNGKAGVAVDLDFDGPSGVVRNRPAPETRAKVDTLYREGE